MSTFDDQVKEMERLQRVKGRKDQLDATVLALAHIGSIQLVIIEKAGEEALVKAVKPKHPTINEQNPDWPTLLAIVERAVQAEAAAVDKEMKGNGHEL